MGNFCAGKQAKKEAKLEDKDRPGDKTEEDAPGVGVSVGQDGVNVELKDGGVAAADTVEEGKGKADDGMRVVKDRAKEIAKEAEAKLLARKHAVEEATRKAEEEAKAKAEAVAAAESESAANEQQAAEDAKAAAEEESKKNITEAGAVVKEVVESMQVAVPEAKELILANAQIIQQKVAAEVESVVQSTKEPNVSIADKTEVTSSEAKAAVDASAAKTTEVQQMELAAREAEIKSSDVVANAHAKADSTVERDDTSLLETETKLSEEIQSAKDETVIAATLAAHPCHRDEEIAVGIVESINQNVDGILEAASLHKSLEAGVNETGITSKTEPVVQQVIDIVAQETQSVETSAQRSGDDAGTEKCAAPEMSLESGFNYVAATVGSQMLKSEEVTQSGLDMVAKAVPPTDTSANTVAEDSVNQTKNTGEEKVTEATDTPQSDTQFSSDPILDTGFQAVGCSLFGPQTADDVKCVADDLAAGDSLASYGIQPAQDGSSVAQETAKEDSKMPDIGLDESESFLEEVLNAGLQTVVDKAQDVIGSTVEENTPQCPVQEEITNTSESVDSRQQLDEPQLTELSTENQLDSIQITSESNQSVPPAENDVTSVDRGEETLPLVMRETCIRQTSIQEGEISPEDETSLPFSDDDALLPPPPPPVDFNDDNEPKIMPPPATPDEEILQRVATEVTNQAVQEALRLVTENGLGNLSPSENSSNNSNQEDSVSPISSTPISPEEVNSSQATTPQDNLMDVEEDLSDLPPPLPQFSCDLVPSPPSPLSPQGDEQNSAEKIPLEETPTQHTPSLPNGNQNLPEMDSKNPTEALI